MLPIGSIQVKDAQYIPPPITTTYVAVKIQDVRPVLKKTAKVNVFATSSEGRPKLFPMEMTEQEYAGWGYDNMYVVNWALNKLGMTPKETPTTIWDTIKIDDCKITETFPPKTISAIKINDGQLLNGEDAAIFDVITYSSNGQIVASFRKKLVGAQYDNWVEDDTYVENWILGELQLERLTQV